MQKRKKAQGDGKNQELEATTKERKAISEKERLLTALQRPGYYGSNGIEGPRWLAQACFWGLAVLVSRAVSQQLINVLSTGMGTTSPVYVIASQVYALPTDCSGKRSLFLQESASHRDQYQIAKASQPRYTPRGSARLRTHRVQARASALSLYKCTSPHRFCAA